MDELIVTIRNYREGYSVKYSPELTMKLGKQHWITQENYCYFLGDKYSNSWAFIARGYGSDGASVPPAFTDVLPVWGPHGIEVILHDWLCEYGYVYTILPDGSVGTRTLTRAEIDAVFVEALRVQKYPPAKLLLVQAAFAAHRTFSRPPVPNLDKVKMVLESELRMKNKWYMADGAKLYENLIAQGDMKAKDAFDLNKKLVAGGAQFVV